MRSAGVDRGSGSVGLRVIRYPTPRHLAQQVKEPSPSKATPVASTEAALPLRPRPTQTAKTQQALDPTLRIAGPVHGHHDGAVITTCARFGVRHDAAAADVLLQAFAHEQVIVLVRNGAPMPDRLLLFF